MTDFYIYMTNDYIYLASEQCYTIKKVKGR